MRKAISTALAFTLIALMAPAGAAAVTNATCGNLEITMAEAPDNEVIQITDPVCTDKTFLLQAATDVTGLEIRGAPTKFVGANPVSAANAVFYRAPADPDAGAITFRNLAFEGLADGDSAIELDSVGQVNILNSSFRDYMDVQSQALDLDLTGPNSGALVSGSTFGPGDVASAGAAPGVQIQSFTAGLPVRVENSTFQGVDNLASQGSALSVTVFNSGGRQVDIVGNRFLGNRSSANAGLYLGLFDPDSSGNVVGNVFRGNRANLFAAAAQISLSASSLTQAGNVFDDNGATGATSFAGAEFVNASSFPGATFLSRGDTFTRNFSNGVDENEGAGLYLGGCAAGQIFQVENLVATGNYLSPGGEGSAIYTGCSEGVNNLNLVNSTITGNTGGSAIDGGTDDKLNLRNSIVAGNTGGPQITEFAAIDSQFSNVCNGAVPYPGAGNQCTNPLLAGARETAASPTRNAGSNALVPAGLTTDAFGRPRIGESRVDMGADEFVPAAVIPADKTAPIVSKASLSNKRFRVGKARTPVSARSSAKRRAKVGTRIRYTLSEAATVRFTIERKLAGRRKGKRCVAPTRALRRKKRCMRYKRAGTLKRKALAGKNSLKFSGRIGRRKLKVGSYRLTIKATDAAKNTSKSRRLAFKIVK